MIECLPDDITKCCPDWFDHKFNVVLLTKLNSKRTNRTEIMPWHGREQARERERGRERERSRERERLMYHHASATGNLLVFDLIVEVASKPIVKERPLDVTRASQLHGYPVLTLVQVDVHGHMVGLGAPDEPVALQESDKEVPTKACPEPTQ